MRKYSKDLDIKKNIEKIKEVLKGPVPSGIVVGIEQSNIYSEIYYVHLEYHNYDFYVRTDTLNGAKYIGNYLACHFDTCCYNEWDEEPYNIPAVVIKDVKNKKLLK